MGSVPLYHMERTASRVRTKTEEQHLHKLFYINLNFLTYEQNRTCWLYRSKGWTEQG